jgi:hypothetical protein
MKLIRKIANIFMFGGKTVAQVSHEKAEKAIDKAIEANKTAMADLESYREILVDQIASLQEEVANVDNTTSVLEQKGARLENAKVALNPIKEAVEDAKE